MKVGEIYMYQENQSATFIITTPEDTRYYKALWIDPSYSEFHAEFEAVFPDKEDRLLTSIFIGEI